MAVSDLRRSATQSEALEQRDQYNRSDKEYYQGRSNISIEKGNPFIGCVIVVKRHLSDAVCSDFV
jgi:hypothetical protein